MIYGIVPNVYRDKNLMFTKSFVAELKKQGVEYALPILLADKIDGCSKRFDSSFDGIDAIITIGGDGTILYAISKQALPIAGINLGNIGFLTEFEHIDVENICKMLKSENFTIAERMMLTCNIEGNDYVALNDFVFARENRLHTLDKVIKLQIYANDILIDRIMADGLIISTPTGSTAYSLAAGGPIVSPIVDAILVTPICSHSLHNRPIVLAGDVKVKVEVMENDCKTLVSVDGRNVFSKNRIGSFVLEKSSVSAKFMRFNKYNFYSRLLKKLNSWD